MTSWETASSGYDPDKFYTQASDKRGHSVKVAVNIPTTISSQIAKIIAAGYVDAYGTQADLIRDAIVHHLERLSKRIMLGELERTVGMHVLYSEAVRRREERESVEALIAEIQANCQHYLTNGHNNLLREYVVDLLDQADSIPEEYRSEYLGVLEAQLKLSGGSY